MLNPPIDELLAAMADALARAVMPELAPGPARDELQAAIALTRRLARAVPQLGVYLHDDTVDLARTLSQLWASLGQQAPSDGPVAEALSQALALPSTPPPTTTDLTAVNLTLRRAVADLAARVATPTDVSPADGSPGAASPTETSGPDDDGPDADRLMRDLLLRLAQREADQLRLSPWAPIR